MDTKSVLRIDAGNSRVSFSVRWFGVIRIRGTFTKIAGTVTVPGPGDEDAAVAIEVDPTSVKTGISLRDRHLRGMRFLDSGPHPTIRFLSDHVTRHDGVWDLIGRLKLRGHERPIAMQVSVGHERGPTRQLTVDFSVPRRPHSIGTASGIRALNPLLWAIGEEVTIHVEVLVPATMLTRAGAPAPAR